VRAWQTQSAKVIDPRVPADQLLLLLAQEAQRILGEKALVQELFLGEMAKMLPLWADRFEDLRKLGRANIAEVLRIGIAQKLFRSDLDTERLAGVLEDFQLARWILRGPSKSDAEFQESSAIAFEIVLRGLLAKP
jgi:hypothetical protein